MIGLQEILLLAVIAFVLFGVPLLVIGLIVWLLVRSKTPPPPPPSPPTPPAAPAS